MTSSTRHAALLLSLLLPAACGSPNPSDSGASVDPQDDAGEPESAPHSPRDPQRSPSAGPLATCAPSGSPCMFTGVACCAGLFCQAAGGGDPTPRCLPPAPECLPFGTPCSSDGGVSCCAGLVCDQSSPTHVALECVLPPGGG